MAMASAPIETHDSTPSSSGVPRPRQKGDNMGLGEFLRRARERRGLTLQQIAGETKIPRRHLEALEHDNITAVPGGLYRRAQIRAFARAVRADEDQALAKLERALDELAPRLPVPDSPPTEEPILSRRRMVITIVVVVAAAVFGRVFGGRESASLGGAPRHPALESERIQPAPVPATPSDAVVGTVQRAPLDQPAPAPAGLSGKPIIPATQSTLEKSAVAAAAVPPITSVAAEAALNRPATPVPPVVLARTDAPDQLENAPLASDVPTAEEPRVKVPAVSGTELVVITEPAGAHVTVNGIGWGVAPITVRYLPPGDKLIRVSRDGYLTEERVVRLGEHTQVSVDIQLRSTP
jgi:cytoskeletal protein RodZ